MPLGGRRHSCCLVEGVLLGAAWWWKGANRGVASSFLGQGSAEVTGAHSRALPPCRLQMACCAKVQQPAVPCESVAGSADVCGIEFADFSSAFLSQPGEALKAASPTGSEAVVPVMPLEQEMDAALAVPSFKDLKDFDVSGRRFGVLIHGKAPPQGPLCLCVAQPPVVVQYDAAHQCHAAPYAFVAAATGWHVARAQSTTQCLCAGLQGAR